MSAGWVIYLLILKKCQDGTILLGLFRIKIPGLRFSYSFHDSVQTTEVRLNKIQTV